MKVLIWILTFFTIELLNTIQSYATGFRVGYLIVIALEWFIASTLCQKWDEHKKNQATNNETNKEKDSSATPILYCRRCGEKLIENSRFCRKCGTEVIISEE